jgi:general secretion pathway protein A
MSTEPDARAVEELRMLSNFQFGTQALLQSFLIGQPEFRKIMQSPQMQQLRQRVIAACHIGPMDQDETQAYIEHRLKCAGSKGSPRFDAGAFEALFEASGGVPRRINAHCDRLLLAGFLNGKSEFARGDVEEWRANCARRRRPAPRLRRAAVPTPRSRRHIRS